jgi:fatty-acyl-CoA synthase
MNCKGEPSMRTTFLTLACPDWDIRTIAERGSRYGFEGVDFRCLQRQMDITSLPEFTSGLSESTRILRDCGLAVSGLSTSIALCDGARSVQNIEEARRIIDLAGALDVQSVRLFGGGDPDSVGVQKSMGIGTRCMEEILELPGARGLRWNIETHDHWISRDRIVPLLKSINSLSVGLVWDICMTAGKVGEAPKVSIATYGSQIGYVHVKDARPQAKSTELKFVLPGRGQVPLESAVRELQRIRYSGWVAFEHLKYWLPSLESAEEALPAFIEWFRTLLRRREVVRDPTGRPVTIP